MLQGKHFAICLTFIKLPFVIKIFVLSTFEWPFYTGFTVVSVSENAGFSLTWLQIPKTDFLAVRTKLSGVYDQIWRSKSS